MAAAKEKESVKNVSACDWPKFSRRLTRPQCRSAGHLQSFDRARPKWTSSIEALAVTAVAQ